MTRPWTDEEDEILTRYASQPTNGNVNWIRTQHYMPWRSVQQMRARWKRIRERDPSWKRTRKMPVRCSPVMSKKSKTGIDAVALFPVLHDYVVWKPTTYDEVGGHTWLEPLFEECEE